MEECPMACFSCAYIVRCEPTVRPRRECDCPYFKRYPYGKPITVKQIAEWLKISRGELYSITRRYGLRQVIELLALREKTVTCEIVKTNKRYVKFELIET